MAAKVDTTSAKNKTTVQQKTALNVSQEQYRLRKIFQKTSDLSELCDWLSIPPENSTSAVSAADYYNQSTKPRKVRKLIYELDFIGDTALADSVMDCAELPADISITPDNLKPIFQALSVTGRWEEIGIIPPARAKLLCKNFSIWRQPAEAAKYYALYHENPSWKDLSRRLYRLRETEALNITKTHIQTVKDQTLTPVNTLKSTQDILVWEADHSYNCLDMPESVHEEITSKYSGEQAKLELFTEWLAGHPCPGWEDVRELLKRLEEWKVGKKGAAEMVEETYIKRPQLIPAQKYSHQVVDVQFPGICFLGEPHVVAVQSKAVTISPAGHGITLNIPPNATQSSDNPVNVSVRACLSSSVFQFPENCTLLSTVYLISSDSAFDKDVELMFEHFAELKTEKQTKAMTVFRADFKGSKKYEFTPIEGGEFKEHRCSISTKQVGFVCAGSVLPEILKRYTVLCSYSNQIEAVRHVAVAISLDHAVYITNFRKALEEEWKVSLSHRCKLEVFFNDFRAYVEYNQSNLKGWIVKSQRCILTQEYVDYPNALYLAEYDYPPRVILDITQLEGAEMSTLNITVSGMSEKVHFQVPLKASSATQVSDVSIDQEESQSSNQLGQAIHLQLSNDLGQNTQPPNDLGQATHLQPSNDLGQNTQPSNDPGRTAQPPSSNSPGQTTDKGKLKKPNLLTLMNLKTSQGDLKIIRRSAKHYHDIGILLLNDHHGDRVDVIVHDKMKANAIMLTVYKEWIDEDPKCSWDTLTECFRQCELTSLASSIEQHFELPSPKATETERDEDNVSSESEVNEDNTGTDSELEEYTTASESEKSVEPVAYDQNSVRSSVTEAVCYLFSRGTLRPDLQNLKEFKKCDGNKVNILQQIHDADSFGRILLDKDGILIEEIKNESDSFIEMNEMIINFWLDGMGKRPITWKTLARATKKLGLIDLAKDIQHGPTITSEVTEPIERQDDDIPQEPKKDDIPQEPKKDDIPQEPKKDDIPQEPKKDDIPQEPKKDVILQDTVITTPRENVTDTRQQVESEIYWSKMNLFLIVAIPTASILLLWICKKYY